MLKTLIERQGFYDREKELNWKKIKDLYYVAAMGPPGGARNPVDPRFVSLFNTFEIQFPSSDNLRTIYAAILKSHTVKLNEDIRGAAENLTDVTLELYNYILEKLPATPSRFHYIFNLRDLSRVYEGLLCSTEDKFKTPTQFIRLWRNEVLRIFHDRLISEEDKAVVLDKMTELLEEHYQSDANDVLKDPILFGDYKEAPKEVAETGGEGDATAGVLRLYEDVGAYADIKPLFEEIMTHYNGKYKDMNLVFFEDALEHLTRVHRIIRLDQGNALLVGVGGSGKQSLSRLAAFTAGCEVFEITLTRGYDETMFRDDLKSLYTMIGVNNQKVMFLFTDSHVADEGFLELINNMLTSGMVPALYADDEKEGVTAGLKEEVVKKGLGETKEAAWNYFVDRCRNNLHVVLGMSPVGDTLRTRCRNFPGMVNNTVIDWFQPWPEDALRSVSQVFLKDLDMPTRFRDTVTEHMVMTHQSVRNYSVKFFEELRRYNYVTPKNYLDFIANYKKSLEENRVLNQNMTERLDGGLQKLIMAGEEVTTMQETLSKAKVVVAQKTKEVNELLETIAKSTALAEKKSANAVQKEEKLKIESEEILKIKEEAENDLAEAIPALEAAADALKNLRKEDITELKSFAKPNVYVQKVCECVGILQGIKDISWAGAKLMMTDNNFLKSLFEFDKDKIKDKQIKALKAYTSDEAFTVENVMGISQAGGGMLRWVFAMIKYNAVARTVEPKRKAVAKAEKSLRASEKDLAKIKKEVKKLNKELAAFNVKMEENMSEQQRLKDEADLMQKRLAAAEKLIKGLASERTRWTADLEELAKVRERLLGDCLLTSSFLSYTGAFTFDFRQKLTYELWLSDVRDPRRPGHGAVPVGETPRGRRRDRSVGVRGAPLGRALDSERHPHDARVAVRAVHRPADASGDVDQAQRGEKPGREGQDVQRLGLFETARARGAVRSPFPVREPRRVHRPGDRSGPREEHHHQPAEREQDGEARGQGSRLGRQLHDVPHDEAPEPALRPGDQREDNDHQLLRHARGFTRPAAERDGAVRAPRSRRRARAPREGSERVQDAPQPPRGHAPEGALVRDWEHSRQRGAHSDARGHEDQSRRDRGEPESRDRDVRGDQHHARAVHPSREARQHLVLHHVRPQRREQHVRKLARDCTSRCST